MPTSVLTRLDLRAYDLARGFGMDTHSSEEMLKTCEDAQKALGDALLIGGMAVNFHGYKRTTEDVDIHYANYDEADILRRLKTDFKIVLKAKNGWHHLQHRKTKVRLELVPEGGLGTYGFIPAPRVVGGEHGFITLFGLIWLKLVAGRIKDDADIVEVAKKRMAEMKGIGDRLPAELRERYATLLVRAQKEMENDPSRLPEESESSGERVSEAAARYGQKRRARGKKAARRQVGRQPWRTPS